MILCVSSYLSEVIYVWCYFFFSSRRRHTRFDCDWSSDVCSTDLGNLAWRLEAACPLPRGQQFALMQGGPFCHHSQGASRSEERRVGKEGRSRWSPYH